MFVPVKSDTGAVKPWEYLPAAAGDYKAGQLLSVSGGKVTAITAAQTAAPPYLSMADKQVTEAGELLPVVRVGRGEIYETTLSADAAALAIGAKLKVSADGTQAAYGSGTDGAFEVVAVDGKAKDDTVWGRFTETPSGG